MRIVSWAILIFLLSVTSRAQLGFAGTNTTARLLFSAATVKPGSELTAAVHLRMNKEWHNYWQNPGESGIATTIEWELPAGITAGEIQWPIPESVTVEGLVSYVYHDEALLLVPLKVANDVAPGALQIVAKVEWLECKESCLPGKSTITNSITVGSATTPSDSASLIEQWRGRLPLDGAALKATAGWAGAAKEDRRTLIIEFAPSDPGEWDFMPYASDGYQPVGETKRIDAPKGMVRLQKTLLKLEGEWPKEIKGVLTRGVAGSAKPQAGYEVTAAIAPSMSGAAATTDAMIAPAGGQNSSLLMMLAFAFLGGLILNVMPCVLPVISLKILGFVQQSSEEPKRVRKLGLIYAVGVVCSFLALAALVIGVKAAGGSASWGMQFQNPVFVIALTGLVILVAMNLFGVFEVTLGGGAMGTASALASKEGGIGAFFNGVLATILATPCTAPFLGAALGFAFVQPSYVIVLIFTSAALGLAFPYVLLTSQPAWLRFLPKPGLWMVRFKVFMGFPMLATAIWLFTVASVHFSVEKVFWLGLFFVMLAIAAWVWGEFVQKGERPGLSRVIAVGILGLAYFFILERELTWRSPAEVEIAETSSSAADAIRWQKWSPEAVAAARAEGHPVLVDFTALWCATCRANKKAAIDIPSARARLKELNVVSFKADFTRKDPAIAAEFPKYGRSGVPITIIYPADPKAEPILLPEAFFLQPQVFMDALNKAAATSPGAGKLTSAQGK